MKTVNNILEVTYGAGIDMARPMADLNANAEKKITKSGWHNMWHIRVWPGPCGREFHRVDA